MKLIKFVMAILGLIFGVMLFFWLFGLVTSLLWYGLVITLGGLFLLDPILGAIGYGGYRLFKRAEQKYVGGGSPARLMDDRDYSLSWEEYDRKYLKK